MGAGKLLIILGAICTLLGIYVFAIYGGSGYVGSGIGFIMNTPELFTDAAGKASALSIPIWWYYVLVGVFMIYLVSGVLQLLGIKNRFLGLIFSLFPLGVGLMFLLLVYTDILGLKSAYFALFHIGAPFGDIYPFLVPIGDLALGNYLILAGGTLGFISTFLSRD